MYGTYRVITKQETTYRSNHSKYDGFNAALGAAYLDSTVKVSTTVCVLQPDQNLHFAQTHDCKMTWPRED